MSPTAGSPEPTSPRLGFIDAGRLGCSLAIAVQRSGHAVTAVSRRDPSRAADLASSLGDQVLGTTVPQDVVDATDVVFLTTTDDRIAPLAETLSFRPGQTVIHCSGATPVSTLSNVLPDGSWAAGFHPLQTFPDEHGADRFEGVTFGIESDDPSALAWLKRLASDLGGTCVTLDDASRPLYHASAVMIGPLTAALAGLASELWSGLGYDRDTGLRALAPLLLATGRHVADMGIPSAMTGPFVRGDVDPVRAHVHALESFRPETLHAYAALALAQLPLAAERGNIPGDRVQELRSLLADAGHAPPPPPTPRGDEIVAE
ncbi:MAG: DUF2520 domain-containing protein [Gemmatimonadota bacterium]